MKLSFFFFLIIIESSVFSQQIVKKIFTTKANEIELHTFGLDEVKIINTTSNEIEISLYDENLYEHHINLEENTAVLKVSFELNLLEKKAVFKKFITERIDRAYAVVKIPKGKKIIIYGDYVDVVSKDYLGDLHIYIEKGTINLNEVEGNVAIALFQGNVFAEVPKSNVEISTRNGCIKVNDIVYQKSYKKEKKKNFKLFKMNSIHANVNLFDNFK